MTTTTTRIEALLLGSSSSEDQPVPPPLDHRDDAERVENALASLAAALEESLPLLQQQRQQHDRESARGKPRPASTSDGDGDEEVNATWLLDTCRKHSTSSSSSEEALDPVFLARTIVQAAQLSDPASQQGALFDALGASPSSLDLLSVVTPLLPTIRQNITLQDIESLQQERQQQRVQSSRAASSFEDERRHILLAEALDAAQVAAVAQAEVEYLTGRSAGGGSAVTHTLSRRSDLQAQKHAHKAAERARKAMDRAREAGAVLDADDGDLMMSIQPEGAGFGAGGLMNKSNDEVAALREALLPEGSRYYVSNKQIRTEKSFLIHLIADSCSPSTMIRVSRGARPG